MRQKVSFRHYWMIAVLGIAVAVGLNNILLMVDLAKYSKAYQEAAKILYAPPFAEQILITGIFVPIVEELVFRGLVFRVLRKWIPFVWAMVLSAVLFGIYHGNLVQFVYASLCGLLLGYVYEVYGMIFAPILAHMVMNLVVCIMTKFGGFTWIFQGGIRVSFVTVICMILTLLLTVRISKVVRQ